MIRVFLVMALLCFTLTGCSGVEWFPEQNGTPGDTPAPTVTAFAFAPKLNVAEGSTQTSESITLTVSGTSAKISVAGAGKYRIGSGAFTDADGTVSNGDQVTVQHTHTSGEVQVVTTLTVGDKSATFVSSTAATTEGVPAFTITPKSNSTVPGTVLSDPFTVVLGNFSTSTISIDNGEYRIGGGVFISVPVIVRPGNVVQVQHQATTAGQTVTTLTIGDRSATFVSNTVTVADFSFQPSLITDVAINTLQTSSSVTLTIAGGTAPISVSGETPNTGDHLYSINNGPFTTAPGTARNGDRVRVQHTSLGAGGHAVATTLKVGEKTATFTTRTASNTVTN